MQSVRRLAHLHVGPIRDYVHASDKSYDPSSLYATAVSTNFTDASLRKSESRTFVDPQLFELCESLVREVSASDGAYEYTLAPDNLTHIRYTAGGFFSRHTDHCRSISNLIEEFTFIVNINLEGTACKGGSTVIHVATASGDTSPITYDCTTSLGGGLLFRKDVEHGAQQQLTATQAAHRPPPHTLSLPFLSQRASLSRRARSTCSA